MNKIDQRIVEMSFENAKFEKGIKQSKNSLKDFTKALEQSDTNKSFSGLNKGLSGVSSSFSAMEQVSIGALRRIGAAVVELGANIVKSIAIEPITQGFQELELKMDSTKTIMASTGESLEVVNQKLNELNEYSDKTIYSFADMTQNIGKFTNAGVKLDLAVSSIQGIANAAALAGANANEASRAMYNFATAISSGSVKLIDWKSIELANMGTVEFKQQLIDAAVAAGTLTKTTDGMYKVLSGKKGTGSIISATRNFNESLQEQWMTTEVLTSTLAKYADTTTDIGRRATQAATEVNTFSKLMDTLKESVGSGWAQTFELIFGDFEQSKKLWTGINDALGAMIETVSDVRNSLLKGGLGDLLGNQITGRENIIQGLKNVVISFLEVIKPISEAWDKIFPPMTVERLYKMTEMFKSFTEQLRINEKTADSIKRTFAGLFAVLDIIKEALRFVGKMVLEVINVFIPLGGSILDITANIGDFIVGLRDAIKNSNLFAYALLAIKIGVTLLKNLLVDAYTNIRKFIKGLMESDSPIEYLLGLLGEVGVAFNKISTWIQGKFSYIITKLQEFFGVFQEKNTKGISTISTYFKSIGTTVSTYAVPALEKLKSILSTITFEKIKSFVIGGVLIALAWQLGKAIKGFTNLTDTLSDLLKGLSKNKSSMIRSIKDLAISIGILAGSLFVLSKIPAETIYTNLLQIGIGLGEFLAALALIKVIDLIPSESKKLSINFMSLSVSLLALIAALKLLGKLDTSVITKALPNIIILTGIMSGMQVLFGLAARISNGNKVAVSMGSVTTSLLGMTAVVGILALIPTETINKGVLALAKIALVIAAIEVIMGLSARIGGGNKFNASLITVTIAMTGMVGLVAVLGTLEDTTIKKGLITLSLVTGLLASFQVLSALASKIGTGVKTSLFGMIGLATVVVALAASLAVLSMVDQDALSKAADNFTKVVITTGVLASGTGVMLTALSELKINSFTLMTVLKSIVPTLVAGAAIFGTMFLFFKGVQFILDDVKNISWNDMGKLAAGLILVGAVFKSIAVMAVPLQVIGSGIGPALLGAVAIAGSVLIGVLTVVASVYIVVGAFAGLATLLNNLDASVLSSGFDKLAIIGAAIGDFFGNILGGFVGGTIEQAGSDLASFFKAIEGITNVDSIKTLAEAFFIMSFTRASSVTTFTKQVRYLITEMSELDPSDIDLAIKNIIAAGGLVNGLTVLSDFSKTLEDSGGLVQLATGNTTLNEFAKQVSKMVATFSSIKLDNVIAATKAITYIGLMIDELTILSDFSKTLEDSGGLVQLATGNTTLNEFAKQIKGLVNNLEKIKSSDISTAKSNVTEINKLLDSLKKISTINTELSPFSTKQYLGSIEKLLAEAKNKISSFAEPFYEAGKELLANLKKPFYEEAESLNDIGAWIPKSIASGIKKETNVVSAAGVYMAEALEESIRNATDIHSVSNDVYYPIGKWVPKSMAIGINKNTKIVSAAGVDMTEQLEADIKDKIGGASNEYKKQGTSIPTNIASGLDSAKSWLTDKASKLGIDTGNFSINGISTAIDSGKGIVTQGIQSLLDNLTGNAEVFTNVGDEFVQGFQDAISNATSGLGGTETAKKVKTELEKLQEYIEEEKYYGRISLRQELNEYLKIQSKYVTGSEERIKIDREVYRLQKSIYENQKQYIEDVTKAREDATEEALELETSYSKEVKDIQKEREDEYTKIVEDAEEKRKKLKEEYAEKEKEIYTNLTTEIRNVYKNYYDELSSRTDTITSSYGLFDAIPEAEAVSGETLLKNLKDQVYAIEDWDKSLTELAARGIGTTLIETLQDMGPSASAEIKALLSLSDEQLTEYVELYGDKYAAARTRAESELVTLKNSIPGILEALRTESKTKMDVLKKEFKDAMVDIDTEMYGDLVRLNANADLNLKKLDKTFQENLASINTGLKEDLATMKTSFDTSMNEIVGLTVEELQELNEQYEKQIPLINEQLDKDLDLMVKVFADNGKEVNAQVNSDLNTLAQNYKTGGTSAINNLIQGLNQGIIESIPTTQEAAKTMVEVVINELRSMIESFKQIGIESARAYIDGLNKSGEISVTGISSEIGQVYNPNTSISSDTFAGISNDLVKANNTSIANISSGLSSNNDSQSQNGSKVIEVQYVQNNNSPKALSRLDIYRATQTQLATLKEAVGNV